MGGGIVTRRLLAIAIACVALTPARAAPIHSLVDQFSTFAHDTAAQPMADRIRAFRARFGPLFPAFYRPRDGRGTADYDRAIADALRAFPSQQANYEAVAQSFDSAFAAGLRRFQQAFPGFRLRTPVYLLHSLGEMNAGTRVVGGRRVLIFGADGIARYDTRDSMPMLLDHELFHIAHSRNFPGCLAVWCTLWREGLATYAAATLNPGATDRQLGLDFPVPLRPAVDRNRREALCVLHENLDATGRGPNALFFLSSGGRGDLPPRFGYYLGLELVQRVAGNRSLATLMAQPMTPTHALLKREVETMVREMGGCPPPPLATRGLTPPPAVADTAAARDRALPSP